ncbi:MAG TPA: hypothetical protein VMT22_15175 [Terriglobales bacterium]|nr:hypothetical protein [Terriglobales bacterium]
MKRTIGFALATGLALLVAGCANEGGGAAAGGAGGATAGTAQAQPGATRNFNLAVKCPGVHYLKKKGWTDQQIMEQESLTTAADIPACEEWVAHQPKGYVPGAPAGSTSAEAVKASNAPGPNAAPSPAKAQ